VVAVDSEATCLMLLHFKGCAADDVKSQLAECYGVAVESGDLFGCGLGFVRMNFACPRVRCVKRSTE
jgi:bifunctional pyridoxal-dependent enzyme with beta-cystathionase and maltose regulon repressor activities